MPTSTEGLLGTILGTIRIEQIRAETRESLIRRIETPADRIREAGASEDPDTLKRVATVMVRIGDPAEEILKKAAGSDCDILIMGTHGKASSPMPSWGASQKRSCTGSQNPSSSSPSKGETMSPS